MMSSRVSQGPRLASLTIEEFEPRLLYSTYVVSGASDGPGTVAPSDNDTYVATTLRAAITAANAQPGADVVRIPASVTGRIAVPLGELVITGDLTLQGAGANVQSIEGTGAARIFNVRPGVTASINDVTVANGGSQFSGGGGIRNEGTLTLSRVTVRNNNSVGADGGGLFNVGTVTIVDSTFSGNSAASGGGLFNGGTASVINSTFAGNVATGLGGGLYNRDGATLRVASSTVSGNRADQGGGIASTLNDPVNSSPGTRLHNTIVAGNTFDPSKTESEQSPLGPDLYGYFDAASANNVVGSLGFAKGLDPAKNLLGSVENRTPTINALLSPLGYYGGTTQTMPPMAGSRAINAGGDALLPAGVVTDQRGRPRVAGGRVDIGSVETAAPVAPPPVTPPPVTPPPVNGGTDGQHEDEDKDKGKKEKEKEDKAKKPKKQKK